METTTYRTAGLQASAAATRARLAAPAGLATAICAWPAGVVSTSTIKPAAKQMFVDSNDHRRRRLSEPSP